VEKRTAECPIAEGSKRRCFPWAEHPWAWNIGQFHFSSVDHL